MVALRTDDRASGLLAPVRELVVRGLAHFPEAAPLEVRIGEVPGFSALTGDEVTLSSGLLGPGLHHPLEPAGPVPPLDRWRRAAAAVLEAAALRELARRTHLPPGDDWRWVGAAIHAADVVAPELQLAGPDVASAIATGSPGSAPRAGVAVMRAWAAEGADPIRQVRYLLEGGVVSAPEWLRLGQWVLSPEGAGAALPVPVARIGDSDIPVELPAWSWRGLKIPAHARGGRVQLDGDGAVDEPWAVAGVEHHTLAAAAATACRFVPSPGGPVGSWDVASAEGFGQVMGARGVRFDFRADGRVDVVLADAFVGPLAAVALAGEVGTSGLCAGRWRVAGPNRVAFDGLDASSLTLHSRTRDRFLMPARGFGLGEWLLALGEAPWSWQLAAPPGDRLQLRGRMMGGEVEVRLKRA